MVVVMKGLHHQRQKVVDGIGLSDDDLMVQDKLMILLSKN